ncbi:MAG: isoaspartyl peptidase/L-asparaginase family protein [Acidimicrobiales bacterium]
MNVHIESGTLGLPAIVLHGGAGAFAAGSNDSDLEVLVAALRRATDAGWAVLTAGARALDGVVEAVASLEDSGHFNAGRGAVPTRDGTVELDAGVMDAEAGVFGALCAATYPANPVRAARVLAGLGGLPDGPVLLAGAGADQFCEANGLERMRPEWLRNLHRPEDPPPVAESVDPTVFSDQGTVGAVAVDLSGRVAAATSTGGRAGQWPGRVGDSPIPGAGVLADRAGVAVSATGAGETFLVSGFAHRLAWSFEAGRDLRSAVEASLAAVERLGGSGGGIAITAAGEFVSAFSTQAMARCWRGAEDYQAHVRRG